MVTSCTSQEIIQLKNLRKQKLIEQSKTKTTKAEVVDALKDIDITESKDSSNDVKNETEDGENTGA